MAGKMGLHRIAGKIPCLTAELRLDITLACGQSFRWRELKPGTWSSVLAGKVWHLSQDESHINYEVLDPNLCEHSWDIKPDLEKYEDVLKDYFQLHVNLTELYTQWKQNDEKFAAVAPDFSGVRILRQDPTENLFAFICSSNNHISRISGMVEKLCRAYGQFLLEEDGTKYYAFPSVKAMTGDEVEGQLRELGFGYRAKFISQSAKYIHEKCPPDWLNNLRDLPYEEAKKELMKLMGVGAKVADCVCLMSLDKTGAIPVDTHVWQIAARDYMPQLKSAKSLKEALYKEIGDVFRDKWGPYAGWAHSVMFSADLKKFADKKSDKKSYKKSNKTKTEEVKQEEPETKNGIKESPEIDDSGDTKSRKRSVRSAIEKKPNSKATISKKAKPSTKSVETKKGSSKRSSSGVTRSRKGR